MISELHDYTAEEHHLLAYCEKVCTLNKVVIDPWQYKGLFIFFSFSIKCKRQCHDYAMWWKQLGPKLCTLENYYIMYLWQFIHFCLFRDMLLVILVFHHGTLLKPCLFICIYIVVVVDDDDAGIWFSCYFIKYILWGDELCWSQWGRFRF